MKERVDKLGPGQFFLQAQTICPQAQSEYPFYPVQPTWQYDVQTTSYLSRPISAVHPNPSTAKIISPLPVPIPAPTPLLPNDPVLINKSIVAVGFPSSNG